jgi:hypothetical protein
VDTTVKSLEELVQELPPDMVAKVHDFIEFLLSKRERQRRKYLMASTRKEAGASQLRPKFHV